MRIKSSVEESEITFFFINIYNHNGDKPTDTYCEKMKEGNVGAVFCSVRGKLIKMNAVHLKPIKKERQL